MERRAEQGIKGRCPWAALAFVVPVVLAGCANESSAYVIDPDRAQDSYPIEHAYPTATVGWGESLSHIAARCGTTSETLERLNDLDGPKDIYPGEELRVPSAVRETVAATPRPRPRPKFEMEARANDAGTEPRSRPERSDRRREQTADTNADPKSWWSWWMKPSDDADSAVAKFVWPVKGRVIEGFGDSGHGEKNDGINIAAQDGAPIRAAAAGTVTYTGNELKGYGNLILIKHANGYVTAYAHAGSIRVSRGEAVEEGEIIGTAGQTGDVDRPQLHFEIRRGVEAVDPERYLARSS